MSIDPANARELAGIASEIGADVLSGGLHYPSETGGWPPGDLDLSEYPDRYRNQRPVAIFVSRGQAAPQTYTYHHQANSNCRDRFNKSQPKRRKRWQTVSIR